jgi:signal transduction histidine kinase
VDVVDGIPVTSGARTVIDLARTLIVGLKPPRLDDLLLELTANACLSTTGRDRVVSP